MGRTTALAFAERGANVVIADIDIEGGGETAARIEDDGGDALFVETDVTAPTAAESMVEAAVDEYGRLDYAFNNAGIGGAQTPVAEYDPEDWHAVVDVNLVGVFNCMQPELGRMQTQDEGASS